MIILSSQSERCWWRSRLLIRTTRGLVDGTRTSEASVKASIREGSHELADGTHISEGISVKLYETKKDQSQPSQWICCRRNDSQKKTESPCRSTSWTYHTILPTVGLQCCKTGEIPGLRLPCRPVRVQMSMFPLQTVNNVSSLYTYV